MDLNINNKITITVDEYDTIRDFSHILQKYCKSSHICGDCEICTKIGSCHNKTQVIDIILYELDKCGAVDIV